VSLDPNQTIVNTLEVLLHISGMISKSCSQLLLYYLLDLASSKARVRGRSRALRCAGGGWGFSHFIVSFLKII